MKALILDGFEETVGVPGRFHEQLSAELESRGCTVQRIRPAEHEIAWCHGEFNCWVKTPGICMADDMNREIARAIAGSDIVIYTTPVTFGGYSSDLKKAVDHVVQNIMPYFVKVKGETHHSRRYARQPRFAAFGMLANDRDAEARTFRTLVRRNAYNMQPPAWACGLFAPDSSDDERLRTIRTALDALEGKAVSAGEELQGGFLEPDPVDSPARPRDALLLVGSPRGERSSSQAMLTYLKDRLEEKGIHSKTVGAVASLRSEEGTRELLQAADSADLVVIAYPLYIDSLPAPLIRSLELIAAHRAERGARGGRLAAIANCGFPESAQNLISLSICRGFARRAGYAWAGGLALGCGEGVVQQKPLAEGGGRTQGVRSALDLAAEALAAGAPIPSAAANAMARGIIPAGLFRLIGRMGWNIAAKRNGVRARMWDRPYEAGPA